MEYPAPLSKAEKHGSLPSPRSLICRVELEDSILKKFEGYSSLSALAEKGLPLTLESLFAYREGIVWMISIVGPTDRVQFIMDLILGPVVYPDRAPWLKHQLCVEFRRAGSQTAISVGTLRGTDPCWEFCEVMPLQISFVSISMATQDLEMRPPRGLRIERTVTPANEKAKTKPTVRLTCHLLPLEARRSDPELEHAPTVTDMPLVRAPDAPVDAPKIPFDVTSTPQPIGTMVKKSAVPPRPTAKPGTAGPSIPHGRIVRARTLVGIPGVTPGITPTPPVVRRPSPLPPRPVREEYAPGSIRDATALRTPTPAQGPTIIGASFGSPVLPPLPHDRPVPVTGVPPRPSSSPPPPLASSEPPAPVSSDPPVNSDPPEAYLATRRAPTTEEHPSSPRN
jgi:hypothetical protein